MSDKAGMSSIDRYKKKGGFIQLLGVLEGSSPQKQENFLALIGKDSPAWEATLRKKMLDVKKILAWAPEHLTDIFASIPPLTTAMVLHGLSQEELNRYMQFMDPKSKRQIQDLMNEKVPSAAEKSAVSQRLVQEVRGMITKGQIKMEKIDPELVIEDNIEFKIDHGLQGQNLGKPSAAASSTSSPSSSSSGEDLISEVTAEGTTLRFELPKKEEPLNMTGPASGVTAHEVEQLRKKVLQMSRELDALKIENKDLKARLEQIRKIA